jgi:hypothetical protein
LGSALKFRAIYAFNHSKRIGLDAIMAILAAAAAAPQRAGGRRYKTQTIMRIPGDLAFSAGFGMA